MRAILVTGAGGYIGSKLAHKLLARGDAVICALRGTRPRDGGAPLPPRARMERALRAIDPATRCGERLVCVHYDIEELLDSERSREAFRADVRRALERWGKDQLDDLIHVAADMSMSARPERRARSMRRNADGTRVTCELGLDVGTRCFTDVSTWYVCGTDEVITRVRTREELRAMGWLNFYQESKAWGEREALDVVEAHNRREGVERVALRIVRPSIVVHELSRSDFGWNRVELHLLYNRLLWWYVRVGLRWFSRSATISMPHQLHAEQCMNLVPIEDVERGLLMLAGDPSREGVFHLSAPRAEGISSILGGAFACYYPWDNLEATFGDDAHDPPWVRALRRRVVDVILGDLEVLVPFAQEVFSAGQRAERGDTEAMGPEWEEGFPTFQEVRARFVLDALAQQWRAEESFQDALSRAAREVLRAPAPYRRRTLRANFEALIRRPTGRFAQLWKRDVLRLFEDRGQDRETRRRYIWAMFAHHPEFWTLLARDAVFARGWAVATRRYDEDVEVWRACVDEDPSWRVTWRRQLAGLDALAPSRADVASHLERVAAARGAVVGLPS